MSRVYNFNPGPATLPLEVLKVAQSELLDYKNSGMSILEINHLGDIFANIIDETEKDLRELLNIPDDYVILFLHGGVRTQFAMLAMNLLGDKTVASYVDTGVWSQSAIQEAKKYCQVHIAASSYNTNYTNIPDVESWELNGDSAYLHYTSNETVNGVEFFEAPDVGNISLVSDMSSNILSSPIDISRFGMVYAGAQKNLGPAGVTIVIIKKELLKNPHPKTPTVFNYQVQADQHSLYNTAPTFSWYMLGLMLQWIKENGGVEVIYNRNKKKAEKLYDLIDNSNFYNNQVDKKCRSRMNIPFFLIDEKYNINFLREAEKRGLLGLKGHPKLGGMRASIYNSMSEVGVDSLCEFMCDFEKMVKYC